MAESAASRIIAVTDIEWKRHETLAGIRQKALWSDPATERRAMLTRFEPGASLPTHRHTGDEILYVIEGAIDSGADVARRGSRGPGRLVLGLTDSGVRNLHVGEALVGLGENPRLARAEPPFAERPGFVEVSRVDERRPGTRVIDRLARGASGPSLRSGARTAGALRPS